MSTFDLDAFGSKSLARYQKDPVAFLQEVLGVEFVWDKMREMAESVRDNKQTAVAGCHSSSKTFTAARLAWWWVLCFQPAVVVITSPKAEQLKDVMWNEIRQAHERAKVPLGGDLQSLHWRFRPDTFIVGMTARKDTGAEGATAMQGYKSPRLLLIMDEAVGIDRAFYQSAPGILTYPENRWLALANPTNPNCGFRDCFRRNSGWNAININAFDTPNLREGRIVNPHLPNAEWVEQMKKDFGEGSPTWEARVLGRFPSAAIDTLISIKDVDDACGRAPVPPGPIPEPTYMGVDVARQGDDRSSIWAVRGNRVIEAMRFQIPDLVGVAGRVMEIARGLGLHPNVADQISVDAGGMGWGVVDTLKANGWHVNAVDFGSVPKDEERFYDTRTELWSNVGDWLRSEAALKNLPPDDRRVLESDLCGCTVDPGKVKAGRTVMKLESKADMKKRLGHSPDDGDALALAVSYRIRGKPILKPRDFASVAEVATGGRSAALMQERHAEDKKPKPGTLQDGAGFYE